MMMLMPNTRLPAALRRGAIGPRTQMTSRSGIASRRHVPAVGHLVRRVPGRGPSDRAGEPCSPEPVAG